MQVVTFTQAQTDLTQAYAAEHVTWLVVFSVLIAMLASFASFNHVQLIRRRELTNSRVSWTLLGAVAMGAGVWAMHFTGMLSYQLPMDVNYHTGRTALSVVPAVLAGYVTLTVISKASLQIRDVLVGGVLMGAGIGLMHYIGMSAMILPAERLYQPLMFALSILVAIVLATLSLSVRPLLSSVLKHPLLLNLLASVFMGLAITSMHYVAMHATVFMPLSDAYQRPAVAMLENSALVTIAVAAAVFIVLISSLAVVMRFRLLHVELGQKAAQAEAKALEDRFRTIAERVPGMVYEFRLDASGQMSFPYTSDAVRDVYGVTPTELFNDASILEQIIHPDDLPLVYQGFEESARAMQPWQSEYRVIRRTDGAERWLLGSAAPLPDADGAVIWSGVITDITERKKHDEMVYQLAFYDALTELPNRRLIYRQLEQKMVEAEREGWCGVVIFIDVDSFKRLNDSQGHSAGDSLLRQIGARLQKASSESALVGRLSSDEFVVVEPELAESYQACVPQATQLATELLNTLNGEFDLEGHRFSCALSIGICMFRHHKVDAAEILKRADIAMHEAKRAGGNQWRLFDPAMQSGLKHRYQLEQALRSLINHPDEQLSLHLQPQVNANHTIVGAEVLLRWQHPDFGPVSPGEFIPLAEETGLIVPIGQWVIAQACELLAQWQQSVDLAELTLSVNVSARQFYQPDFVDSVLQQVMESGPVADRLVLELTESLVLEDIEEAVKRMLELKAHGIRFSMDDFGTGYSSLSYLATLPFDEVKIDQSFIHEANQGDSSREWIIIEAIIGLADKLHMQVIAEGVESQQQQQALLHRNCYAFQGFYFSKPLTQDAFVSLVATQRV